MSLQYDLYLEEHRNNVAKGLYWIGDNFPELLIDIPGVSYEHQICYCHDLSKNESDEYNAYDAYFYGGNRSSEVIQNFNYAWLSHIHRNPHHWQHWLLVEDDKEGVTVMDMPYNYIIEMICDWWSFSWKSGDLFEIFSWYDNHKNIQLSNNTKNTVEYILKLIKNKLEETKTI